MLRLIEGFMSKILHLTRDFPPRWNGGISTAVASIVRTQRANGDDITICSFDGWRPTRASTEATSHPLERTRYEAAHYQAGALSVYRCVSGDALARVQETLRGQEFDQVEVHHPMLWPVLNALELGGACYKIYVAHVHAAQMDALRALDRPTHSAQSEEQALQEADLVVATSMAQFKQFRTMYPVLQSKLMCRKNRMILPEVPRWIPYTQRAFDLGIFGRFSDLKNTDAGLRALSSVLSEHPSARAVVVGGIPDNPKTERKRWAAFLAACPPGVSERVQFLGWLARDAALEVMANTRMVVAPSRAETWGLVVQEAMALGCCVVATPLPAHIEQIEDRNTGVFTANATLEAVERRVGEVFRDDALQKRISDAARTRWMAQASEEF